MVSQKCQRSVARYADQPVVAERSRFSGVVTFFVGQAMDEVIKLSSPGTQEFLELPVLFEDEHLLALDKPADLLTSSDAEHPDQPNLTQLLHDGIEAGKGWATRRGLSFLMNAHRLDIDTTGVLL